MMADLVPRREDRLRHRGMRVDRPAGDEEGRLQVELVQQFEELRRADAGLEAAVAHRDQAVGVAGIL